MNRAVEIPKEAKPICGYEENYVITPNGEVYSLPGLKLKHAIKRKLVKNRHGYYQLSISKRYNRETKNVHRLVAKTFIPNPDNLPQVNHKDGNKSNNHISNLEWCTRKQNMEHMSKMGLYDIPERRAFHKKRSKMMQKFNEFQVERIKLMKSISGFSIIKLSKIYKCERSTIRRVLNNQNIYEL